MKHAFFADMGGFRLQCRDWQSFPIDAKQLLYLIKKGYVARPNITQTDINDKNKVDGLVRWVAQKPLYPMS